MTDRAPGTNAALDAVVWIAGTLAVGSALMAVAHAGVRVPLLSGLGPGGSRVVVPAAITFAAGACLHGAVAYGVAQRYGWAWAGGAVVMGVTLLGAAVPFRGAGSIAGIALAGTALALLLSGAARRTMLRAA